MSKAESVQLRVRVPKEIADALEEWAEEKYPDPYNREQLLLIDILRAAVRRHDNTVSMRKVRERRSSA